MTLQQAKDLVVKEFRHENFDTYLKYISGTYKTDRPEYAMAIVERLDKATRIYTASKIKEALQLAADRATTKMSKGRNGCKIVVDPESILSLETEILKQINEE